MTRKILFGGASMTAGCGLPDERNNKDLWANQLAMTHFNFKVDQITNIANTGADNKTIFYLVSTAILNDSYSNIIVQWQTFPRTNIHLGLELYNTRDNILAPESCNDHNLVAGQKIYSRQLNNCKEFYMRYYNYHWDILSLINYIRVLVALAEMKNSEILFVNYNLPWKDNPYFTQFDWNLPSDLDSFTREILEVDLRGDEEIRNIYKMIHRDYQLAGSIHEKYWINLYKPLSNLQIDHVSTVDKHPGIQSQFIFANFLAQHIK